MRITIVGAYGYTGALICEVLEKRSISFQVAGKRKEDLEELKKKFTSVQDIIIADLNTLSDVHLLLDASDVVINCVGPFEEESQVLLDQVAKTNKIYLDISGELLFVRNSYLKYHELAKAHGATIVHGCAFESLIVDLLLSNFSLTSPAGDIKTFYKFSDKKVSPGTKNTYKLFKYKKNLAIRNSDWKEINPSERQYRFNMDESDLVAIPFPLPELAYINWQRLAVNASSYLLLTSDEALLVGGHRSEEGLERQRILIKKVRSKGPTPEQRLKQSCSIYLRIEKDSGEVQWQKAQIWDMYGTTARAMVDCLEQVLKTSPVGVVNPASLFPAGSRNVLKKLGVEVTDDDHMEQVINI